MCGTCDSLRKELAAAKAQLAEWGIGGGAPIKLVRESVAPFSISPGDSVTLTWTGSPTSRRVLLRHKINATEAHRVDTVAIYQMRDALGFDIATMCAFGTDNE